MDGLLAKRVLVAAVLGVVIAAGIGVLCLRPHLSRSLTRFAASVRRDLNGDELRRWARDVTAHNAETNATVPLDKRTLPGFIRALSPHDPIFGATVINGNPEPRIEFYWGDVWGLRYGLVVGTTNLVLEEDASCVQCLPGIYAVKPSRR